MGHISQSRLIRGQVIKNLSAFKINIQSTDGCMKEGI
jgi:hypothetical protein